MTQTVSQISLYEQDILRWAEETAAKLRARDFDSLDLENLVEEVESLGIAQRHQLLSRLTTLIEHMLKRMYVDMPNEYNGWERTVRNQQTELEILLKQAPSLKARWDIAFGEAWTIALKKVKKEYKTFTFPNDWQGDRDIDTILDIEFESDRPK